MRMSVRVTRLLCAAAATAAIGGGFAVEAGARSATTASSSGIVDAAKAAVAQAMKPNTAWLGPNTPVKAVSGKSLGIVDCAPVQNCERLANGAAQAGKALGWKTTVLINKSGAPPEADSDMLNLINGGANALAEVGVPRSALGPVVVAAQKKHVVIQIYYTPNDNQKADVQFPSSDVPAEQVMGKVLADYLIARSNGHAQVVMITDNEGGSGLDIDTGFINELKKCAGCAILGSDSTTIATFFSDMASKTASLLERFPQAQYVMTPYDSYAVLADEGIREAGKAGHVFTVSTGGETASFKEIASNAGQIATVAVPFEWMGWAAVDQILREMRGQPIVNHPMPLRLFTAANVPSGGTWQGDVNYQAHFKALWGVK
jgi:ribose transport system substrate-binding protein